MLRRLTLFATLAALSAPLLTGCIIVATDLFSLIISTP